jgi:hypothetical protein
VLAVLIFLFWGGFFVEHLNEWFIAPRPRTPPASVWFGQFLHLMMLVGLLVVLRWPRIGAVLVIGSALAFFPRAGQNYALFTVITSMPALLLVLCWYLRRGGRMPGRGNWARSFGTPCM